LAVEDEQDEWPVLDATATDNACKLGLITDARVYPMAARSAEGVPR
jgi:hypothetical protein